MLISVVGLLIAWFVISWHFFISNRDLRIKEIPYRKNAIGKFHFLAIIRLFLCFNGSACILHLFGLILLIWK
jgi:hypothetical protein